ncbi:MAG: hypothetical protein QXM96_00245 [Candidatus Woesearchaeota archaeon]
MAIIKKENKGLMTTFVSEGWSGLPPKLKGAVFIGGLFLVFMVYIKISKKIKKSNELKDLKKEEEFTRDEFNKLQKNQYTKSSLNNSQLLMLANKIETAMQGYGTDFRAIVQVFLNLKNDADFLGLSLAFGVREIRAGRGSDWLMGSFKGNLIQCLNDELNKDEIFELNKILAKNKIKYRI